MKYAKTLTVQRWSGVRYQVRLQVGAVHFVFTNINVSDGLFNGATGTLKLIEYGFTRDGTSVPKRVWMDFGNPVIGVKRRQAEQNYAVLKRYYAS